VLFVPEALIEVQGAALGPLLQVQRPLIKADSDLEGLYDKTCTDTLSLFEKQLKSKGNPLLNALRNAGLSEVGIVTQNAWNDLVDLLKTVKGPLIQVRYDFIRDLAAAWNALVEAVGTGGWASVPDTKSHPRHVALGFPGSRTGAKRHTYRGPWALDRDGSGIEAVRRSYRKLRAVMTRFDSSPPTGEIRIRPQDSVAPSTNLVPYYFTPADRELSDLRRIWSPSGPRARHPDALVSLFQDDAPDLLSIRHDRQRFYRVEGVLGSNWSDVRVKVEELREKWGLPFDVAYVKLDGSSNVIDEVSEDVELIAAYDEARREVFECLVTVRAELDALNARPELVFSFADVPPTDLRALSAAIDALSAAIENTLPRDPQH